MQVSKWGNSLAIRLPVAVVAALELHEGDEVVVEAADARHFRIARDPRVEDALATLRGLGWSLPEDFRSSRDEANSRKG